MSRYFIGLMLPPPVQAPLTALAETIQASVPANHPYRVSWNHPADLHCTLLFLGASDDKQFLIDSMTDVAALLPPATLTAVGTTHWLGRNSLAVPVTGAEHLGTTFIKHVGELSSDHRAGRRPFHGHVTIGRVRPVPRAIEDVFGGHELEAITWQVSQVQLVKGTPGAGDRRYQVVAQARLSGLAN